MYAGETFRPLSYRRCEHWGHRTLEATLLLPPSSPDILLAQVAQTKTTQFSNPLGQRSLKGRSQPATALGSYEWRAQKRTLRSKCNKGANSQGAALGSRSISWLGWGGGGGAFPFHCAGQIKSRVERGSAHMFTNLSGLAR